MDTMNFKKIHTLSEYIDLTRSMNSKPEWHKRVSLDKNIIEFLKSLSEFEVEYFKKYNETGAAIIIFGILLRSPSIHWQLYVTDIVLLLKFWLDVIKDDLIIQHYTMNWWIFLKEVISFIQRICCTCMQFSKTFLEISSEILLKLVTSEYLDLKQINIVMKCLNLICSASDKRLRAQLMDSYERYFIKLTKYAATCAHLDTQLTIMECLMRFFVCRRDEAKRAAVAAKWFPTPPYSSAVRTVFVRLTFITVFQDLREFLIAHNSAYGHIESVECNELTVGNSLYEINCWLDFHKSLSCVTVTLSQDLLHSLEVDDVFVSDVLTLSMANTERVIFDVESTPTLTIYLSDGPQFLNEGTTLQLNNRIKLIKAQICNKQDVGRVNRALGCIFHKKYQGINTIIDETTRNTISNSEDGTGFSVERFFVKRSGFASISKRNDREPEATQSSSITSFKIYKEADRGKNGSLLENFEAFEQRIIDSSTRVVKSDSNNTVFIENTPYSYVSARKRPDRKCNDEGLKIRKDFTNLIERINTNEKPNIDRIGLGNTEDVVDDASDVANNIASEVGETFLDSLLGGNESNMADIGGKKETKTNVMNNKSRANTEKLVGKSNISKTVNEIKKTNFRSNNKSLENAEKDMDSVVNGDIPNRASTLSKNIRKTYTMNNKTRENVANSIPNGNIPKMGKTVGKKKTKANVMNHKTREDTQKLMDSVSDISNAVNENRNKNFLNDDKTNENAEFMDSTVDDNLMANIVGKEVTKTNFKNNNSRESAEKVIDSVTNLNKNKSTNNFDEIITFEEYQKSLRLEQISDPNNNQAKRMALKSNKITKKKNNNSTIKTKKNNKKGSLINIEVNEEEYMGEEYKRKKKSNLKTNKTPIRKTQNNEQTIPDNDLLNDIEEIISLDKETSYIVDDNTNVTNREELILEPDVTNREELILEPDVITDKESKSPKKRHRSNDKTISKSLAVPLTDLSQISNDEVVENRKRKLYSSHDFDYENEPATSPVKVYKRKTKDQYKEILETKERYISRRSQRMKTPKPSSPRINKQDEIFDKLMEDLLPDSSIKMVKLKPNEIAVYNFTSDEDDDFLNKTKTKNKRRVTRKRVNRKPKTAKNEKIKLIDETMRKAVELEINISRELIIDDKILEEPSTTHAKPKISDKSDEKSSPLPDLIIEPEIHVEKKLDTSLEKLKLYINNNSADDSCMGVDAESLNEVRLSSGDEMERPAIRKDISKSIDALTVSPKQRKLGLSYLEEEMANDETIKVLMGKESATAPPDCDTEDLRIVDVPFEPDVEDVEEGGGFDRLFSEKIQDINNSLQNTLKKHKDIMRQSICENIEERFDMLQKELLTSVEREAKGVYDRLHDLYTRSLH